MEQLRYGARLLSLPKDSSTSSSTRAAQQKGVLHSKERDRQVIMYHYDRSNDFYKLSLARRMVYSCAYFSTPDESLDTAQERKLDYFCRKLRLRPGEHLLDIGYGWDEMNTAPSPILPLACCKNPVRTCSIEHLLREQLAQSFLTPINPPVWPHSMNVS